MKLILSFILFFMLSTPATIGEEEFDKNIQDIYSEYVVLHVVENSYYRVKIVEGINGDEVNYGIYLFNLDAKSHNIVIEYQGVNYGLESDNRGDYSVLAFRVKGEATLKIVDTNDNDRYLLTLSKRTTSEFTQLYDTNILTGMGKGAKTADIAVIRDLEFLKVIGIVFGFFIVIFSLAMLLLFINKKGMFSPKHKSSDVFSYRKFLEEYGYNQDKNPSNENLDDVKEIVEETKPSEIVNMYPFQRDYEDDEDIDVKKILQDKGYITTYSILPEEEKNQIMLELMRLRDTSEITRLAYQKEVVELWKK